MKRLALIAAAAVALLLAACAVPAPTIDASADPRLTGQWVLQSGSDSGGRIPLVGVWINLAIGASGISGGHASCDTYSARIVGRPGPVYISATSAQTPACTDPILRLINYRYLAALRASSVATIRGNTLTLAAQSTTLTFSRVPSPSLPALTRTSWNMTLISYVGYSADIDTRPHVLAGPATIQFRQGSVVNLFTGCSVVSGTWKLTKGELEFAHFRGANSACPAKFASTRQSVLNVIEDGVTVRQSAGKLTLTNPRNDNSVFFESNRSPVFLNY
jgi:heat shock protein HslJ